VSSRLLLGAIIFLQCGITLAAASTWPIPDTPAGRALGSWLDAFNSGDRSRVESFIRTRASWMNLDGLMRWRAETGGYELLTMGASTGLQGICQRFYSWRAIFGLSFSHQRVTVRSMSARS
jgi:hypothetical protein